VYKHPDQTIPTKAQLTVDSDEVALFFKDGKFVGQLAPGRHTMQTGNIPFLDQLVDWGTGGNLWIAEVYFVLTREVPNQKFGGKIGKVRDPQSGLPVELMVNGTYSIKVIDAPKLVIGLAGMSNADNEQFLSWFREAVLRTIKDNIAELMVKKKWPMLDVTSGAYTDEICTEVITALRPSIEPYGVEVVRIGNFNLGMKDEDEKTLNELYKNAAYMQMTGGTAGFQQMAAASAMMNAGEAMKQNPGAGGGALLGGAGLGVGLAMAQQMAGAAQPGRPQQPAPGIPGVGAQQAVTQVQCPKCQKQVAPGKFCAECGGPLAQAGPKFCSGCGAQITAGSKFCSGCGAASPA
jgi:membrane protease subunit (stomatin/prohibitin family)